MGGAPCSALTATTDKKGGVGFEMPNTSPPPTPKASVTGSYAGSDHGAKSVTDVFSNETLPTFLKACSTSSGVKSIKITTGTFEQS